jgi:hypothetical protein
MAPLNTFILGGGGSSGSHLLASMLHGFSGIRVGPEINLFHPHGLYNRATFSLTLYKYLTRRGHIVPFDIPGVVRYGLVPGYILEHRTFYGVDTIAAEWELLSKAEDLRSLIQFLRKGMTQRHGWPEDFIWFEHTPRNALAAIKFLGYFPESHFIHLVRDGRDAVLSQWRRFRHRFDRLSDKQAWELALTLWVLLDAHAQQAEDHPRYLKVHFEDLVTSPLKTVNRILSHVGLAQVSSDEFAQPRHIAKPEFGADTGVADQVWQADPNQAIRPNVVGTWRRDAPLSLLNNFRSYPISIGNGKTRTLDEQLSRHGYSD